MLRNFIGKLALPGLIAAAAAGAALAASGDETLGALPSASTQTFDATEIRTHAEKLFTQADLNSDGDLDVDEFATLSIVVAELSRLNGYIVILNDGEGATAPVLDKEALSENDRILIGALAARERGLAAGADDRLDVNEFIGFELDRFSAADYNRNGVLKNAEVIAYANQAARVLSSKS